MLLKSGSNTEIFDKYGHNVLHLAARLNRVDMLQTLAVTGMNLVNTIYCLFFNLLTQLLIKSRLHVIFFFFLSQKQKKTQDSRCSISGNNTALHYAFQNENKDSVLALIINGANVDIANDRKEKIRDLDEFGDFQLIQKALNYQNSRNKAKSLNYQNMLSATMTNVLGPCYLFSAGNLSEYNEMLCDAILRRSIVEVIYLLDIKGANPSCFGKN